MWCKYAYFANSNFKINFSNLKLLFKMPASDFQAALNAGLASTNVLDLYYYAFASNNLKVPGIFCAK
jgi:hypothetical protein